MQVFGTIFFITAEICAYSLYQRPRIWNHTSIILLWGKSVMSYSGYEVMKRTVGLNATHDETVPHDQLGTPPPTHHMQRWSYQGYS